jgi:tetraacyldisaccharide 4'-kinase
MRWLEQEWYRLSPLHLLLWPLSIAFGCLVALRRSLYRAGRLRTVRLRVPVIVVGNITAGGTGKTPLVIWLAQTLSDHGYAPGIVLRGHGGNSRGPEQATATSNPARVGDEAVLLARRTGRPVWIGADRPGAAQALLAAQPQCNVLISDDGLQHYPLARDIEIAVVDGERCFGNGLMIPAGPLREPPSRLGEVDAVVVSYGSAVTGANLPHGVPAFDMRAIGRTFYQVADGSRFSNPESFVRQRIHAVAGIGNPGRFFEQLRELGLTFAAHPFPDHHLFTASDLAFSQADAVLMTEKDAVKCERFAMKTLWALRVDADVDPALGDLILSKLRK